MEDLVEQPSTKQIVLKWGPILGLVSVVISIITFTMAITNSYLSWVGGVVTIIVIVLAHREYKNEGDGFMSYGKGLGIGTLVCLVSATISSILSYLYIKVIDSSYLDAMRDQQISEMESQGLGDAEIEQALEFASFFNTAEFFLIGGLIGGVFIGFILSLIVSAFTKNADPAAEI